MLSESCKMHIYIYMFSSLSFSAMHMGTSGHLHETICTRKCRNVTPTHLLVIPTCLPVSTYLQTQIQIHKYKCTNTQIHKYKYANTQIQLHKYKYTNTNTQIHIKCEYCAFSSRAKPLAASAAEDEIDGGKQEY